MKSLASTFADVSRACSKIATFSAILFFPFVFQAAATYVAAHGAAATAGGVLTSFWSPLVTDPVTGNMGITECFNKLFDGAMFLGQSAYHVASAAVSPETSIGETLTTPMGISY